MDRSTQHLVDFTLAARYDSLDSTVIHECKRRLIDTFGCAIGAFHDPLCTTVREMASEYRGPQAASLWGTSHVSSTEMATFCNGIMLRIQDFNDTYFAADGAHPSDMLSAIVAVADAVRADGRSLLLATATGYEIFCRFMQAVDVGARNFDQTLYGSVASSLAVGQLMGLSRDQLGHAVALAITPHLSLRQTRKGHLSQWKGCAAADAARNAVFAANLAARGVSGPSRVFEGDQGLWSVLGRFDWIDEADWPAARMVTRTYFKNLAVCYHAQAAAQAAIELHPKLDGRNVASVDIAAYEEAVRMIGRDRSRWAPQSRETADHSLPFIVATCLRDGMVDVHSFDDDRLGRSDLVDLMNKTRVEASATLTSMYPQAAPAQVVVRTSSGEKLTAEVRFPRGHPNDPMSDSEVERKFRTLCNPCSDARAVDMALSALWSIDECRNVGSTILPRLRAITAAVPTP